MTLGRCTESTVRERNLLVKAVAVQGNAGSRVDKDSSNKLLQGQSAGSLLFFVDVNNLVSWTIPLILSYFLEC